MEGPRFLVHAIFSSDEDTEIIDEMALRIWAWKYCLSRV